MAILSDPQLIKPESFRQWSTSDPRVQVFNFHFQQPSIGSIGSIAVKDGVVNSIHLNPRYDVTLGDLVNKFGEPPYLFVEGMPGGLVCYDVSMYYPDQGIMARILECHDVWRDADVPLGAIRLGEENLIESVHYFEPVNTLDQALLNIWLPEQQKVGHIPANVIDWEGFAIYDAR